MQLIEIKLIETLASGAIYSAIASEPLQPGQNLSFDSMAEILRCQPAKNGYDVLFFSSEKLPDQANVRVIGKAIDWLPEDPVVMFCEGIGNFTAMHWINQLRASGKQRLGNVLSSLVLSEPKQFRFQPVPSRYITPEYPANMIAAMPLLDDLGIISRLVCEQFQPGCYEGTLSEMVAEMPERPNYWAAIATTESINQITDRFGPPVFAVSTEDLER